MKKTWEPRLPNVDKCFCIICREQVTAPPFIASKPRKGPTLYIHTECFQKEQRGWKENKNEH